MYLGISEDVSRAKTHNSLKFPRDLPRLSAQMYLVLSKSGLTRGGKGLLAISQLLTWPHSVVVLDIKGELYDATARYRETLLGVSY